MNVYLLLITIALTATTPIFAQDATSPSDKEAAYTRTIHARAQKIVATLDISDSLKANRVTNIIAGQYRKLNEIHSALDSTGADAKLKTLHAAYLKALNAELNTAQVEKVKDGMTYGVLPITYKGYLDMLPALSVEQRTQIMQWLVEAREHAMDAGSSDKKHWWFGKYKGRINNYLSAAGYDLKKESEDWHKRIKEREAATKNVKN